MSTFSFKEAYARLCESLKVSTQVQLAAKLQISQPSISNAYKRKMLPETWLTTAHIKYNVSPRWVKEGIGSTTHLQVAASLYPQQEPTRHAEVAEIALNYASGVPVHTCQCEYIENKPFPQLQVLHTTALPARCLQEGICVVYYELSAFEPQISKNAYVGIDTTNTRILAGEVYAIFTPLEGLTLKRIFPDAEQTGYILQVDSAPHRDTHMSAKQLNARIFGRVTWTLNDI